MQAEAVDLAWLHPVKETRGNVKAREWVRHALPSPLPSDTVAGDWWVAGEERGGLAQLVTTLDVGGPSTRRGAAMKYLRYLVEPPSQPAICHWEEEALAWRAPAKLCHVTALQKGEKIEKALPILPRSTRVKLLLSKAQRHQTLASFWSTDNSATTRARITQQVISGYRWH